MRSTAYGRNAGWHVGLDHDGITPLRGQAAQMKCFSHGHGNRHLSEDAARVQAQIS